MVKCIVIIGGHYDDNFNYVPGYGWDNYRKCYRNEGHEEDNLGGFYEDYGKLIR